MERQDTDMEARGPSNVNIVDAAASHPRCSLRSTDSINKGESSAPGYTHTIAPYFLQPDETETGHRCPILQWRSCKESTVMSYPYTH